MAITLEVAKEQGLIPLSNGYFEHPYYQRQPLVIEDRQLVTVEWGVDGCVSILRRDGGFVLNTATLGQAGSVCQAGETFAKDESEIRAWFGNHGESRCDDGVAPGCYAKTGRVRVYDSDDKQIAFYAHGGKVMFQAGRLVVVDTRPTKTRETEGID